MDIQELVRRYTAGERNFAGIDLIGIDFDALYGSFEGIPDEVIAYLNEIDFTSFDLGRELREQYAAGRRDFSGLNLSGVNLTKINLSRTNLEGINLSGANLSEADLSRSNLSRSNLSGIIAARWGSLNRANLSGANLSGANLSGCEMMGVNLENAVTRGARLGILGGAFVRNTINPEGILIEGPMTIE